MPTNETVSKEIVDAAKDIVKKKRTRPDLSEKQTVRTNPGDNAKYIGHNLELMQLGKPDMTSTEAIKNHVITYFTICERNDMKPSVEGMALAFGVERKTIQRWVNGVESNYIPPEGRAYLKMAYSTLTAMMADYMQNGKINPVSGIFLMKNNMGYADQTEIVVTPNNPLGAEQSAEEIQKRITDGVIVEVPEE